MKKAGYGEIGSTALGKTDFSRDIRNKYIRRWLQVPFPSLIFKRAFKDALTWVLIKKMKGYPAPPATTKRLSLFFNIDLFLCLASVMERKKSGVFPMIPRHGITLLFHWKHLRASHRHSITTGFYPPSSSTGLLFTEGTSTSLLREGSTFEVTGAVYPRIRVQQPYKGEEGHEAEKGYPDWPVLSGLLRPAGKYRSGHRFQEIAEGQGDGSGENLRSHGQSRGRRGLSSQWDVLHTETNISMVRMTTGNSVSQRHDHPWRWIISRPCNMISHDYTNQSRRDGGDLSEANSFFREYRASLLYGKGLLKHKIYNNLLFPQNITHKTYLTDMEDLRLFFDRRNNFNEIKEIKRLLLHVRRDMENVPSREFIKEEVQRSVASYFDINQVVDRVYSALTRKIRLERERRGLYA